MAKWAARPGLARACFVPACIGLVYLGPVLLSCQAGLPGRRIFQPRPDLLGAYAGRARPLAFQARQAGWPINPPNTLPVYHPQIGCREKEGAPLLPAAGGRRPIDQGKEGANPMKGRRKKRGAELASH